MSVKRKPRPAQRPPAGQPSSLLDTRIVYYGDCLDQLRNPPDGCVDLIYIDPPFNSNRNYEVLGGETKGKRAFNDRHPSTLSVRSVRDMLSSLQCRSCSKSFRSER